MAKKEKHIPFRDLIDTPYYDLYLKMINSYSKNIIKSILSNQTNEVKYTWNDVLKEVFKFVNGDLRKFPETFDVNPNRELLEQEEYDEAVKKQTMQFLGIDPDGMK